MIKVSVIVPVYNVEKYIEKCLESLRNQNMNEIEFIIVNDGSKDNSQIIIDKYVEKDKRFKSIIKDNGGQGSARNTGFDIACGEYIAYVDSDDYVAADMFEKMYLEAKRNNSDIVICGNFIVDEKGSILKKENLNFCGKVISKEQKNSILYDKMAVWNKIYKRSYLKSLKIQFREKKWYEDFDFSFKVLISTNNIYVINDYLYYYLQRNGSTMNNNNYKRNIEIIDAFNEIIKYLKEKSIFNDYFYEIEYIAIQHIYLATNVRIICSDVKKIYRLEYVKKINKYFNKNFPEYKRNMYLKNIMTRKKKIIFTLLNFRLYSIIRLIFKVNK